MVECLCILLILLISFFFFYFTPFLTHIFIRNNFPAKQNKKSKQKRYLHEF